MRNLLIYLSNKCILTNKEKDLILRMNNLLQSIENSTETKKLLSKGLTDLINKMPECWTEKEPEDFIYNISSISNLNIKQNNEDSDFKYFSRNVCLYEIKSITTNIWMGLEDFKHFITEKNITDVFFTNIYEDDLSLGVEPDAEIFLNNYFGYNPYIRVLYEALVDDLKLYDSFVKKIDQSKPAEITFSCVYQGVIISCKNIVFQWLSAEEARIVIFLMHLNGLIVEIEKKKNELDKECEEKQKEEREIKNKKLKELETKILNDLNFAKCTSSNRRIKYFKDIIREEDDKVLEYFNMTRRRDGVIITKSLEACNFIDELWNKLKGN